MNQSEAVEFFEHRSGLERRKVPRRGTDPRSYHLDDVTLHLKADAADRIFAILPDLCFTDHPATIDAISEILAAAGLVIE